ncbi:hypothetical protein [Pseudomonas sp.]|nr:hypothetical protein [Pseudomonas sp.]
MTCSPRAKIGKFGALTRAKRISSTMFYSKWVFLPAPWAVINMQANP